MQRSDRMSDNKLFDLIWGSDIDFYEEYLADASLEEQAEFMKKFPEFLEEKDISKDSLDDKKMFEELLEKIREEIERK